VAAGQPRKLREGEPGLVHLPGEGRRGRTVEGQRVPPSLARLAFRLLASFVFLVVLVGAGENDYGPGLFSGLKPGETTAAAAIKRIGPPDSDYEAYVLGGEIDFFVNFPTPTLIASIYQEGRTKKKPVKTVRVLEYSNPHEPMKIAKLIFDGDKLWYAIVPMPPSEANPEKLEERYGKKPSITSRTRLMGHVLVSYRVFAYPDMGTAYAQEKEGEDFVFKVVFPPVAGR
jgi:hypothetical protein